VGLGQLSIGRGRGRVWLGTTLSIASRQSPLRTLYAGIAVHPRVGGISQLIVIVSYIHCDVTLCLETAVGHDQ
jgi:hypothetical protein